jgi:hypothetical protein
VSTRYRHLPDETAELLILPALYLWVAVGCNNSTCRISRVPSSSPVDTRALGHTNADCRRRASVHRQNRSCDPSCMIACKKSDCASCIPTVAFCAQQASFSTSLASFLAHTTCIHHRCVKHLVLVRRLNRATAAILTYSWANAVNTNTIWCMVRRHRPCHVDNSPFTRWVEQMRSPTF